MNHLKIVQRAIEEKSVIFRVDVFRNRAHAAACSLAQRLTCLFNSGEKLTFLFGVGS